MDTFEPEHLYRLINVINFLIQPIYKKLYFDNNKAANELKKKREFHAKLNLRQNDVGQTYLNFYHHTESSF